jgi:hypothetical protein
MVARPFMAQRVMAPCLAATLGLGLMLATAAKADPTYGVGLTVQFGSGQVNTGIGIRVFSDDRRDRVVAAAGLDYMFATGAWRGSLGPAYLGDDLYLSLDLGIDLTNRSPEIGVSFGGARTRSAPAAPPPATPAPAIPAAVTPVPVAPAPVSPPVSPPSGPV